MKWYVPYQKRAFAILFPFHDFVVSLVEIFLALFKDPHLLTYILFT